MPYSHPGSLFGKFTPSSRRSYIFYVAAFHRRWNHTINRPGHHRSFVSTVHNLRNISNRSPTLLGNESRQLLLIAPLRCFSASFFYCIANCGFWCSSGLLAYIARYNSTKKPTHGPGFKCWIIKEPSFSFWQSHSLHAKALPTTAGSETRSTTGSTPHNYREQNYDHLPEIPIFPASPSCNPSTTLRPPSKPS